MVKYFIVSRKAKAGPWNWFVFLFQTTFIYSISHWDQTKKGEFPLLGSNLGQIPTSAQKRNILAQSGLLPGRERWLLLTPNYEPMWKLDEWFNLEEVDGSVHRKICAGFCGLVRSVSQGYWRRILAEKSNSLSYSKHWDCWSRWWHVCWGRSASLVGEGQEGGVGEH